MRTFFIEINKKELILFAVLLFLAVSLPIAVYLAKQKQEIRPRAIQEGAPVKLFLEAPQVANLKLDPGQSFTVDLYLDTAGKVVSAVETHLSYPADLLEIEKTTEINTLAFPVILQNNAEGGKVDIAVGINP